MASTTAITNPNRRRPSLTKGQLSRMEKRRKRNRVLYHEAVALANDLGIELGPKVTSIPDILLKVYERTHALWVEAASRVDQLDADAKPGEENSRWTRSRDDNGNWVVEPTWWVQLETALRQELFEQGARLQQLKIDERAVRVEERQVELLSTALATAARRAGLSENDQKALGAALREELAVLEGSARESESDTQTSAA